MFTFQTEVDGMGQKAVEITFIKWIKDYPISWNFVFKPTISFDVLVVFLTGFC